MQFSKALFSKIVYMFILYNNQIINSEFCSHSKLEIMHSHKDNALYDEDNTTK